MEFELVVMVPVMLVVVDVQTFLWESLCHLVDLDLCAGLLDALLDLLREFEEVSVGGVEHNDDLLGHGCG